ncbi:MAG: exonuclease SbcCD subunit D [Pseudomonadota bacterium]
MRFLHTADWHLGRQLHSHPLLADQAEALEQLLGWVEAHRVDAVLMAGDVYDRSVPPADAVTLLSDTLDRLCGTLNVPVVLIPGNHDSAERIGFASQQLAAAGVHVRATLERALDPVVLRDAHGDIAVYAFPYTDPPAARAAFEVPFASHDAVLAYVCERALADNPPGRRVVAMAHAFVDGGDASDSERPLSIGGSDRVEAQCFTGFDYAALGHLHRPQAVGSNTVRYSGSLGKFSFSEVGHTKGAALVDMDATGEVSVTHLAFTPTRDLMRIEGYFDELIASPCAAAREHYLTVRLLDRGAILDAMPRLRAVYPHVLHLERPSFAPERNPTAPAVHRDHGVVPLFDSFMQAVTGEALSATETAALAEVLDGMAREDR